MSMKRILSLAGAFGFGLGTMYFLDPDCGRRRRAVTRDKVKSTAHRSACMARKTREDLANRSRGFVASLDWRRPRDTSDGAVQARIHSRLGRIVSHPHAIHVQVTTGRATLRGPVLAHEVPALLAAVAATAGVTEVDNQLDVQDSPANIPALQGRRIPCQKKFVLAKQNWPPAARLITALGGGALAAYGLVRGKIVGKLFTLAGAALCIRGITNLDASHLTGIGAGCRAVDLQKTITINAPIEDVFNFWARFENLPRFLTHVRDIRNLDNARSQWTVAGPVGTSFQFNAAITEFLPYQLLAWKTEPGSRIEHAGVVRFTPTTSGGTRLDILMSYNPVAGAIGHLVATLLGSDPKTAMDQDLARFKTLMEQGKANAEPYTLNRGNLSMAISDNEEFEGNPT
jgi:uncharacterized membrane protein